MNVSSKFQKYVIKDRLRSSSESTDRFLAEQPQLNRKVELRIVSGTIKHDSPELKRFNRELALLATLDHPGIIKILDIGSFQNRLFYTTVHRRSKSLESLLKETNIPFSEKEVIKLSLTIGDAIRHMHKNGIIHRNISTQTVYYDLKNLRSYIGEFEMVKTAKQESLEKSTWTTEREAYYVPERYNNSPLDERTDLYMLGALMYRLLTLKKARAMGKNPSQECPVPLTAPSKHNSSISSGLDRIIVKLLQHSQKDRYQDCSSLIADLEGIYTR